jgi:hypothetical protein
MNLSRQEVFGERSGGDIDLLAGPLALTISDVGFAGLVEEERRSLPGGPEGMHQQLAHMRAGREGLVQWPPDVLYTVAIEVKASYFKDGRWKATHEGERAKILGALRERRRRGVNAVAFLHLGVVEPSSDADELDVKMDSAVESFPRIFDPESIEGFGYCIGVMGGVARDGHTPWGAEAGPAWISGPKSSPCENLPWHPAFRNRLAALPRPIFFRTFVHTCPICRRWMHAGSANPTGFSCACGAGSGRSTWSAS